MSTTDLPDPLTPPDCDLRDFRFMPLDVVRLRDSQAAALSDAEAFRACVLSWCASWHQVPAGSLPDDDAALSILLGYGRTVAYWRELRAAGGLRGWVKCSDGRLYHPTVCEKANEAWRKKVAQRDRSRKGNAARWGQGRATNSADQGMSSASEGSEEEQHGLHMRSKEDGGTVQEGGETDPVRSPSPSPSDLVGRAENDVGMNNAHKCAPEIPQASLGDGETLQQGSNIHPSRTGYDPKGQRQGEEERDIYCSSSTKPEQSAKDVAADFDTFWVAYPRKVGKDRAERAYRAARKRATAAVILAALRSHRWSEDPQFIPYPATWLNGGHWQDEASSSGAPTRQPGRSYAGCL